MEPCKFHSTETESLVALLGVLKGSINLVLEIISRHGYSEKTPQVPPIIKFTHRLHRAYAMVSILAG